VDIDWVDDALTLWTNHFGVAFCDCFLILEGPWTDHFAFCVSHDWVRISGSTRARAWAHAGDQAASNGANMHWDLTIKHGQNWVWHGKNGLIGAI